MAGQHVYPWEVSMIQSSKINGSLGNFLSCIDVCRIDNVDTKTMTVDIHIFAYNKAYTNVPILFPYYSKGTGILFVPESGTLGIVGTDSKGQAMLISFCAPSTNDGAKVTLRSNIFGEFDFPKLEQGDILISSMSKAMLKLDSLGGATLASSLFAFLNFDSSGNYTIDFENGTVKSNGVITETFSEEYTEYLRITKGNHNLVVPSLTGDSTENTIELNYSIKDLETGNFIGFDKKGNIHISGDIIKHEVGVIGEEK